MLIECERSLWEIFNWGLWLTVEKGFNLGMETAGKDSISKELDW